MKLIRYPQVDRTQLFDLETDPHETVDLSTKPEYQEKMTMMLGLLAARQSDFGDKLPLTNPNPQPAAWKPPNGKWR